MAYLLQLLAVHLALAAALEATSGAERLKEGNLLFDHGRYREAIAEYEGALMIAEPPSSRADILYRLALAHGKTCRIARR